ncbi:hypothetical protein TYRP_006657 [Tyrophagus putrescentiae]|nr:hypothetical protein TYRP_006657 [Tyrophagus putrescentiae]
MRKQIKQHVSRWQQFQNDDKASKFQSLANKVGTVADIALDYGLLLLKPDPVSIAVALGVTALGVGLYYGFRWYKRREVPEGYASRQVLPLQIGTGRPLYALKPQSSTAAVFTAAALPQLLPADSVRPQSPQSILSNSFSSTFSFCMVVLFIFALNLFLLLLFTTLQNPPPKLKQRSSLFQKKQSSRRKQSSRFKKLNISSSIGNGPINTF